LRLWRASCRRADWITWSDPAHWRVVYDEHNPMTTRLECGGCGHAVREPERMPLVRTGVWRATAPTSAAGQLGFHVPAMLSPFVTLPGLVERWLDAQQRGRESLRTFVNTSLAEAWEDEDRAIRIGPADGLMQQREGYDAVPMAASWITGAIDVQDDRFELLFCGWGARDECWVLHHEILTRDAGYDPFAAPAWERLYRELSAVRFDHASGVKLPVCTVAVDSGFQTLHAYRFTRFNRARLFATKGVRELQDGHFIKFSADKDSAVRRGVPLILVATDLGKQRVAERVADQRVHFPVADWCGEEFFNQLTAETCEPVFNPAGVRVGQKWLKQRPRNEVLDLLVLNFAARAIRSTVDLAAYRAHLGLPAV
jgi:phage terminase large subunit GpA-like protein